MSPLALLPTPTSRDLTPEGPGAEFVSSLHRPLQDLGWLCPSTHGAPLKPASGRGCPAPQEKSPGHSQGGREEGFLAGGGPFWKPWLRLLLSRPSISITTSCYPLPSICVRDPVSDWFESLAQCLHWNVRKKQAHFEEEEEEEEG